MQAGSLAYSLATRCCSVTGSNSTDQLDYAEFVRLIFRYPELHNADRRANPAWRCAWRGQRLLARAYEPHLPASGALFGPAQMSPRFRASTKSLVPLKTDCPLALLQSLCDKHFLPSRVGPLEYSNPQGSSVDSRIPKLVRTQDGHSKSESHHQTFQNAVPQKLPLPTFSHLSPSRAAPRVRKIEQQETLPAIGKHRSRLPRSIYSNLPLSCTA